MKNEIEAAGFVLESHSDALRNTDDGHKQAIFDPNIRGRTDQVLFRFRKPLGSGRLAHRPLVMETPSLQRRSARPCVRQGQLMTALFESAGASCPNRYASRTLRAIGAAAAAPKPPFSTRTEIAILGSSAGAYAINQA